MDQFVLQVKYFMEHFGYQTIEIIGILVFGLLIIANVMKLIKRALLQSNVDDSLVKFILAVVKALFIVCLVLYCINRLHVSMTATIAGFSCVAVAVGLAIQDIIGGIADGLMIISSKPFKVNDFVEIGGVKGTIKETNLMHTILTTTDNKRVILTNKTVYTSDITNYSSNAMRRVDFTFGIDYDASVDKAKETILAVFRNHPLVLDDPAPIARLGNMGDSSLDIVARCWTATDNYWEVFYDIQEQVFAAFGKEGIPFPYPQVTLSYRSPLPLASEQVKEVAK